MSYRKITPWLNVRQRQWEWAFPFPYCRKRIVNVGDSGKERSELKSGAVPQRAQHSRNQRRSQGNRSIPMLATLVCLKHRSWYPWWRYPPLTPAAPGSGDCSPVAAVPKYICQVSVWQRLHLIPHMCNDILFFADLAKIHKIRNM